MGYARKGLRSLGLSFLAVAGLMAFGAAGAQGQLAGKFLDAGGELAVGTTFTGAQDNATGSLLVPAFNIAILCTATDFEEGKVTAKLVAGPPHTPGTAHVKLLFLNCTVDTAALVPLGACKVGEGKTITAKVKVFAMLASAAHGEEPFVLAAALDLKQLALVLIQNETGKFCSVSGDYAVTGTLALKVLAGLKNPQLVIPYANQALLGDGLLFNGHPATLDGSALVELTGPEAGLIKAPFGVC